MRHNKRHAYILYLVMSHCLINLSNRHNFAAAVTHSCNMHAGACHPLSAACMGHAAAQFDRACIGHAFAGSGNNEIHPSIHLSIHLCPCFDGDRRSKSVKAGKSQFHIELLLQDSFCAKLQRNVETQRDKKTRTFHVARNFRA